MKPRALGRGSSQRVLGLLSLVLGFSSAAVAQPVLCEGGFAAGFPCSEVDLLAVVSLASLGGGSGSDCWGWTDPVDGREYVLMGRSNGTAFVDISDPVHPVVLGDLATHSGSSVWRDIKVYRDHAYIVADHAGNHGMQVFDLSQLRDVASPPQVFTSTAHDSSFGPAHNVVIDEKSGFAFAVNTNTCSGGLHMVDIRQPEAPVFAGCHGADGAFHDAQCVTYHGPDIEHRGKEICFNADLSGDQVTIVDVTDKSLTRTLSTTGYAGARVPHQGWLTEDHAFFLFGDEGDELNQGHNARTYVWDVSDLDAPQVVGTHTAPVPSVDHNLYVRGRRVYEANYVSGLRILDLAEVAAGQLTEVAFFDTVPERDSFAFDGAWSVYPFFDSCTVAVCDMSRGLVLVRPRACIAGLVFSDGFESGDLSGWSEAAPRLP